MTESQTQTQIKVSLTLGARPRKPYNKKYNRTKIAKLFSDEECELTEPEDWEYEMNKNLIHYTYEGKPYTTNINRWVNHNHRPHIQWETIRRLARNSEVSEPIISETSI
jgi:hypothetical protein